MKKYLLKSLLIIAAILVGGNVWADEVTATLVHTASSGVPSATAGAYVSTIDAAQEYINNSAFGNKNWQGAAYAEFSFEIPEGQSIKSASMVWNGVGSSKDRTTDVMYVNAGESLDYSEQGLGSGTAEINLPATKIETVSFPKNTTKEFTTDVTDAVKAVAGTQSYVIFKFTNNVGSGNLVGKGAESGAPTLVITTADASSMTSYTVKFTDGTNELKDAAVYTNVAIGSDQTASAEDMASFVVGGKKYIYASGNITITTVAEAASNVITLVFREAATYSYTVKSSLGATITEGTGFEEDEATYYFPQYLLSEGTLYETPANNRMFRNTVKLDANNKEVTVNYTATEKTNVIFLKEAEDIEGATASTAANADIRCSMGTGAFFANDATVTKLQPGKYKITAQVWGNSGTTFEIKAGSIAVLSVETAGYIVQKTSEEFELSQATKITIPAIGNENRVLDFIYIEKTGDFTPDYGTIWEGEETTADGQYQLAELNPVYFKDLAKAGDIIRLNVSNVSQARSEAPARIIKNGVVYLIAGIDQLFEKTDLEAGVEKIDIELTEDMLSKLASANTIILKFAKMTLTKVELIEGVAPVDPNDYTSYIINADLKGEGGFDATETKGFDGSGIVKVSSGKIIDFKQTIENLPAGKYKLTAQAAYRYSGSEADEAAAIAAGTETKLAKLYATVGKKTVDTAVMNRWDGASDIDYANGNGSTTVNEKYVPNSSAAVQAWFNAGQYVNEVEFNLPATGPVTIGIVKTAQPEVSDYVVIGPWTLTRIGDAEEEPAEPLELTLNVERYAGMGYSTTEATVDFTEAKTFLGVEEITTDMLRIVNPDGTLISDYAPYDGWFNGEGVAETWGNNTKICVKFFQAVPDGTYTICDMNGADELGKTYTVKWALVANDKQVTYTINVKFVEKPVVTLTFADLTKVDEQTVALTSVVGQKYEGLTANVNVAAIIRTLEATSLDDITIYAVQSDGTLDDNYKLGTTDGWRNAAGDWQGWGDDAYFYVKADFAAESAQIYEVGGMEGKNTTDPATYTATYAFVKNGTTNAVVLKVTLSYTLPVGINAISRNGQKAVIYNMNGQKMQKVQKGLYIINGKKAVIK